MINNVVLVGRMTKDPDLRRTGNGTAVTSFTLAVNRTFKTDNGPDADFINCVIWNKPAENTERYCSKGSMVGVTGHLQTRSYDNNHGQKIYVTEVICESVQFLSSRSETAKQEQGYQNPTNQAPQAQISGYSSIDTVYDIMQDDIEF